MEINTADASVKFSWNILNTRDSQVAQLVKNRLPTQETQEMRVRSLGGEDALEEEMATYSSVLAWRIPRTEEPGGLQSQTQLSD